MKALCNPKIKYITLSTGARVPEPKYLDIQTINVWSKIPKDSWMPEDVWQYLVRVNKELDKRFKKGLVKFTWAINPNPKRNPLSYKQAIKTPEGGWVSAKEPRLLAVASDIVGRRLAIYPEVLYKQALKKGMDGKALIDLACKDPEKVISLALGFKDNPKRNPWPALVAVAEKVGITTVVATGAKKVYESIPTELKYVAGIGGGLVVFGIGDMIYSLVSGKPAILDRAWRSLPYYGGATITAVAGKYIPKKYEGMKFAIALGSLGLLGLGVYKMLKD